MGFVNENFNLEQDFSPMFEETAFMFQDEPKLWESQLEDFHTEDANPLFLIQGFLNEPKEKQSGGKMNRIPLQRHVILIDVEQLFRGGHDRIYQSELRGLSIQAVVCGHDRLTKEKIEIETVETVKMSKNEKTNVYLPEGKEEWFCVFDHLVIKESSHNYGQKLFLKFKFEINKKVYSIESSTFETISKRAIDKSIKKKYDLREDSNKKKLEKRILNIEPAIGFRSSLSKILISNLEKNDSILIYLGNKFIENYAILNNEVVFEIPLDCPFGELNLKVSMDNGQSFLDSIANFECVDQNDESVILKLLTYLIQTTNDKINKSMTTQISLENMINKYL